MIHNNARGWYLKLKRFLKTVWSGNTSIRSTRLQIVNITVLLIFIYIFCVSSVYVLRWPFPVKIIGILLVVLIILFIYRIIRVLMKAIYSIGFRRIFVLAASVYLLAVFLLDITTSSERANNHLFVSAVDVSHWSIGTLREGLSTISQTPDSLMFIITGRRDPVMLPDVVWESGIPPTPIASKLIPVATVENTASNGQTLRVGASVYVEGTDGAPLRLRSLPGSESPVVARILPRIVLQIVDGPITTDDGKIWWKVRNDTVEGWGVQDFLVVY